jgi:hypothetical protein
MSRLNIINMCSEDSLLKIIEIEFDSRITVKHFDESKTSAEPFISIRHLLPKRLKAFKEKESIL